MRTNQREEYAKRRAAPEQESDPETPTYDDYPEDDYPDDERDGENLFDKRSEER